MLGAAGEGVDRGHRVFTKNGISETINCLVATSYRQRGEGFHKCQRFSQQWEAGSKMAKIISTYFMNFVNEGPSHFIRPPSKTPFKTPFKAPFLI